jgi:hypothetical protein
VVSVVEQLEVLPVVLPVVLLQLLEDLVIF